MAATHGPSQLDQGELRIRIDRGEGANVVALLGELDLSTGEVLESELLAIETDPQPIIIDLSGLEFIDSTGLGVLLRACTRGRDAGTEDRVVFLRPQDQVQRLLELSGIAEHLPFLD